MKIIYPYNEILPLRKAHDAYIFRNCASLAALGVDVTLLCGKGSLNKEELFSFYKIEPTNPLKVVQLPILRRNNFLNLNWNFVFLWSTMRYIQKEKPDVVICSVIKQMNFLIKKRLEKTLYLYEVHQLGWYPSISKPDTNLIHLERSIFNRCNLVTVTTDALKQILKNDPYHLTTPIELIPLACDFAPLPEPKMHHPFHLFYVGQLYTKQGVFTLLEAIKEVQGVLLHIVGGSSYQIDLYKDFCQKNGISDRVVFKGFVNPDQFHEVLKEADAFITTFENTERMPYVAHTKIYEYLALKRPIIAPDLEIVKEHVSKGILTYEPANKKALIAAITSLTEPNVYGRFCLEIKESKVLSWTERASHLAEQIKNHLSCKLEKC